MVAIERQWSEFIDSETKKAIGSALIEENVGGIVYSLRLLKKSITNWRKEHTVYSTELREGCNNASMILDIDNKFLGIKNLANGRLELLIAEGIHLLRDADEKLEKSYYLQKDILNAVKDVLVPKDTLVGDLYQYDGEIYLIVQKKKFHLQRNVYIDLT